MFKVNVENTIKKKVIKHAVECFSLFLGGPSTGKRILFEHNVSVMKFVGQHTPDRLSQFC